MAATVEISIPDTLLKALGAEPGELPRQTLEALIVQAFRKGQITHAQVGELLELNRFETDRFLKNAQAFRSRENEEFASDLEILRRISK
jgi:predicted HTH domain antitoxin